jgi:hypothetical protein
MTDPVWEHYWILDIFHFGAAGCCGATATVPRTVTFVTNSFFLIPFYLQAIQIHGSEF